MSARPFFPTYGSGQTVAVGASAVVAIPANDTQVCLTNTGGNVAYVEIGSASAGLTASAIDYPIPAGAQVVISKGSDQGFIATFAAAATSLHIMTGNGF